MKVKNENQVVVQFSRTIGTSIIQVFIHKSKLLWFKNVRIEAWKCPLNAPLFLLTWIFIVGENGAKIISSYYEQKFLNTGF